MISLGDLVVEVQRAIRRLRSAPGVSLAAIACLSIGVWMACVVEAVGHGFFRPNLHVPQPARLVQLEERGLFSTDPQLIWYADASRSVMDSLAHNRLFASVGDYYWRYSVALEGDAETHNAVYLSSGMMGVLGATPAAGRVFLPSDDGTGDAAMLSWQFWQSAYGGDPSVIGRAIHLTGDRRTRRIVGVMRPDLVFPVNNARPAFYLSPSRDDRVYPDRRILARLADGVSLDDARATARSIALSRVASDRGEMFAWQQARYRTHAPPARPTGTVDVRLERYVNEPVDKSAAKIIWLVLACGIGVAAVAAANVLNLVLVRGAARRQEVAVRLALGASRARIVAELVIESAILASVGVVAGLLLAFWQWQLLDASFEGRHFFGDIDTTTALYAVLAGLLLTMTVGVWPGLRASSMKIEEVLRDVRRAGVGASPLEGILGRMVIGSTAVTVTLLVCAMVFAFSARDTERRSGAGYEGVYTSAIDMDSTVAPRQRGTVAMAAVDRVRTLPGIAAAAIGLTPPSGPTRRLAITPAGRPMIVVRSDIYSVSAGYFDILSIEIHEGRAIDARDSRDSTGAVVIGQLMAHQLFPSGGAIGQTLTIRDLDDSTRAERTARVVGVADDGAHAAGQLRMFFGFGSMTSARTSMVIKAAGRSVPQSNVIGATLRGVPGLSATNASVRSRMSRVALQFRRYLSIGFGMFAVVGLLLATIGTYGVVAYSVVRRTHEIGVRMALGADRQRVVAMILEQGLRLTLVGLALGLVLAMGAAKVINGVVEDMTTNYPLAIAGVMLLVGLVSLAASGIPGYRAGRLNPVDCLRAE